MLTLAPSLSHRPGPCWEGALAACGHPALLLHRSCGQAEPRGAQRMTHVTWRQRHRYQGQQQLLLSLFLMPPCTSPSHVSFPKAIFTAFILSLSLHASGTEHKAGRRAQLADENGRFQLRSRVSWLLIWSPSYQLYSSYVPKHMS